MTAVVALVLLAAACGGDESDPASNDKPLVRVQSLDGGMSAILIKAIEVNDFDESNGFEGEFQYVPVDAATQSFLQGESDVSFTSGVPEVGVAASQDYDIIGFSGVTTNLVRVLVRSDSPYQSIEDLRGEKVGHFGDDTTATLTIQLFLNQFHGGIDFLNDYDLVLNSPPALIELLASGEVEGIVSFWPHISRAEVEVPGGVREIYDPEEDWSQNSSESPLWTTILASSRDWATDNLDTARAVKTAGCDAVAWINENPDEIISSPDFDELMGLDEKAKEEFGKYLSERSPYDCQTWDDPENLSSVEGFLDMMAEQGALFEEVPQDAIIDIDDLAASE